MTSKEQRIALLVAGIREANKRYYDEDDPCMGDVEYDSLVEVLRGLDPEHPVLHEIGNPTFGKKHTHVEVMGSLTKCHTPEEVVDKFSGQEVTIMPKVDGVSLTLHYLDGVLWMAVTRGNGKIGELVTSNAARMLNIPNMIDYHEYVEVRGEAYIAKNDFYGIMDQAGYAGHENGLKNPRNAAAGALRQKDPALTAKRKLQFVAYKVLNVEHIHETQDASLKFLETQGFQTVPYRTHTVKHIAIEDQLIQKVREYSVPYETDGAVIMIDDLPKFMDMGYSGKCPKGALAYKFETEKASAKVLDIEWETSRTGKIKPVAVIEPTEICGSTVARITMNNYQWLVDHDVGIGDTVLFEKANEIIPHLLEVMTRVQDRRRKVPETCPACGVYVDPVEGQVDIVCHNLSCPAQFVKLIRFMLETLQVKGLGESTIQAIMDCGLITNHAYEIFQLRKADLVSGGFGEIESKNIVEAVNNVEAPAERLLASLGIEGWGERMFEKLFEISQISGNDWIPILQELSQEEGVREVSSIKEILPILDAGDFIADMGEVRGKQLVDGLRAKSLLLHGLLDHVTLTSASKTGTLTGASYCITGTLSRPRKQIKADIKDAGGVVKDSITKTLSFLVAGENAGSKLQKAADAGVEVIGEDELYAQLESKK